MDFIKYAVDSLNHLATNEIKFPKVSAHRGNKWRMVSALQKAIRRGDLDIALTMAAGLRLVDRPYMLRRLGVTILEDIGPAGSKELVAAALLLATKGANAELCPERFDAGIISNMCIAAKDRSACDILVGINHHRWLLQYVKQANAGGENGSGVQEYLVDDGIWVDTIDAWQRLGTKRVKSPSLQLNYHNPARLYKYLEEIQEVDPFKLWVCKTALGAGLEGMGMTYALLPSSAHQPGASDPWLNEWEMIGNYPSYALDRHTAEGKRAVSKFIGAKPDTVTYLVGLGFDGEDLQREVYRAIFYAEGDCLAHRRRYHLGDEARKKAVDGLLKHSDPDEIIPLMRGDLPILNEARRKIMRSYE